MKTTMPVTKNQKIILTADNLTSQGSGVGRYEGFAVFVPGLCPARRQRS